MRIHMRRHKSNSVACEICRRHLSSKEALEKHRKIVHFHDYDCDTCHKKLKSKQKLREHIISHLESKFKCPKCPKMYKSKQNLNEHLLKHEGIKKNFFATLAVRFFTRTRGCVYTWVGIKVTVWHVRFADVTYRVKKPWKNITKHCIYMIMSAIYVARK
ncbi:Zinc finger protein [Temnothorax longispinosus]|uniref:Zinc finger protein n=1 Tax=Temnothorax longispinosus TaxID=300112 RepID=A0A4S2JL51_9HYME|nr:Zinc finger protein [Temnothorax longispinosus]